MKKQKAPSGLQSKILRKLTKKFGTTERPTPICQTVICQIFTGRRRATPEQAVMLEPVLNELGYAISKFDMVFAYVKDQPLLSLDKTRQEQEEAI
jgi:hypothetical protein